MWKRTTVTTKKVQDDYKHKKQEQVDSPLIMQCHCRISKLELKCQKHLNVINKKKKRKIIETARCDPAKQYLYLDKRWRCFTTLALAVSSPSGLKHQKSEYHQTLPDSRWN